MSEYIKLEDAINLFGRSGEYHADAIVDMLFFLPTIEVSEDCENCKHENEPRFGTICGSCTKANSENFEPKVSEDAISREDAMDIVVSSTAEEMVEKMRNAPSVVPSRAEGEWLACTKEGLILNEFARSLAEKWYGYKCSECGYIHKGNALRNFNYCPNCGAKMKGADDEAD